MPKVKLIYSLDKEISYIDLIGILETLKLLSLNQLLLIQKKLPQGINVIWFLNNIEKK